MTATVLFVCPHGAGKSRIAAAWFDNLAPPGWSATTAGIEPQVTVSEHAPRLLAGSDAAAHLDPALPRPISAAPDATLVVTIDCPDGAVLGAEAWRLENGDFDEAMVAELRRRVSALVASLPTGGTGSTGTP
jgi:protein-tyrosine-phosphatase